MIFKSVAEVRNQIIGDPTTMTINGKLFASRITWQPLHEILWCKVSSAKSREILVRTRSVAAVFVRVHACTCECMRLICVERYKDSAQYAGHHRLYDSMIVGPLVAQSNVPMFHCFPSLPASPFSLSPLHPSFSFSSSHSSHHISLLTLRFSNFAVPYSSLSFPFSSRTRSSQTHPTNPKRGLALHPLSVFNAPKLLFDTARSSILFYNSILRSRRFTHPLRDHATWTRKQK